MKDDKGKFEQEIDKSIKESLKVTLANDRLTKDIMEKIRLINEKSIQQSKVNKQIYTFLSIVFLCVIVLLAILIMSDHSTENHINTIEFTFNYIGFIKYFVSIWKLKLFQIALMSISTTLLLDIYLQKRKLRIYSIKKK